MKQVSEESKNPDFEIWSLKRRLFERCFGPKELGRERSPMTYGSRDRGRERSSIKFQNALKNVSNKCDDATTIKSSVRDEDAVQGVYCTLERIPLTSRLSGGVCDAAQLSI
jgi:hypothetical protein